MFDIFGCEERFILDALASNLFPDRPFPILPTDLDWERLYALLKRHRLAEHFYTLGKSKRNDWPSSFCERLRLDRYGLLFYGDQCVSLIRAALSALVKADIPVMVLKGWAAIQTIYGGDYGQRVYDDIDILVHPRNADASELILNNLGWQDLNGKRESRLYYNAQTLILGKRPNIQGHTFLIGLHWGLLHHPVYNPDQIDVDAIFERAQTFSVAGVPVSGMSIDDQLVYNCAHIVRQHRSEETLLRYYEIAVLIGRTVSTLDWQKVMGLAKSWELVLPIQCVIKKIKVYWPGLVTDSVIVGILLSRPGLSERFIRTWYEKTNHIPKFEHFLTWLTMSGMRRRLSYMRQEVFPDREYLQSGYGHAPGNIWPLLYIPRFFRVFIYFFKKRNVN